MHKDEGKQLVFAGGWVGVSLILNLFPITILHPDFDFVHDNEHHLDQDCVLVGPREAAVPHTKRENSHLKKSRSCRHADHRRLLPGTKYSDH